jgi:hypothetical protein
LGYIKLFADLLVQWATIAQEGRIEVDRALLLDESILGLDFHRKFYERYLNVGFKCLGDIPDTWDASWA